MTDLRQVLKYLASLSTRFVYVGRGPVQYSSESLSISQFPLLDSQLLFGSQLISGTVLKVVRGHSGLRPAFTVLYYYSLYCHCTLDCHCNLHSIEDHDHGAEIETQSLALWSNSLLERGVHLGEPPRETID